MEASWTPQLAWLSSHSVLHATGAGKRGRLAAFLRNQQVLDGRRIS
jgi:hypothetical protein